MQVWTARNWNSGAVSCAAFSKAHLTGRRLHSQAGLPERSLLGTPDPVYARWRRNKATSCPSCVEFIRSTPSRREKALNSKEPADSSGGVADDERVQLSPPPTPQTQPTRTSTCTSHTRASRTSAPPRPRVSGGSDCRHLSISSHPSPSPTPSWPPSPLALRSHRRLLNRSSSSLSAGLRRARRSSGNGRARCNTDVAEVRLGFTSSPTGGDSVHLLTVYLRRDPSTFEHLATTLRTWSPFDSSSFPNSPTLGSLSLSPPDHSSLADRSAGRAQTQDSQDRRRRDGSQGLRGGQSASELGGDGESVTQAGEGGKARERDEDRVVWGGWDEVEGAGKDGAAR